MTLLFVLLAACDEPEPLPEGPKVQTLLGEAVGIRFLGNWTSAACGDRPYARNIRFDKNNQYAAIDLVSPCPAGGTCVWSGLVGYAGTWSVVDNELRLREIHAPGAPGSPHPQRFLASMDGKLMEGDCPYTEGLTVPPGYTESQVTPRAPGTPVTDPDAPPVAETPIPSMLPLPSAPPTMPEGASVVTPPQGQPEGAAPATPEGAAPTGIVPPAPAGGAPAK